jgi:hypothetical protein
LPFPSPPEGIFKPRDTLAGTAHRRHFAPSSMTFPFRIKVARNQSSAGGAGQCGGPKGGGEGDCARSPLPVGTVLVYGGVGAVRARVGEGTRAVGSLGMGDQKARLPFAGKGPRSKENPSPSTPACKTDRLSD